MPRRKKISARERPASEPTNSGMPPRMPNRALQRRPRATRRAAIERLLLLQTVTSALSGALSPEQVVEIVLGQGLRVLGAYAGGVSLLSDDRTQLHVLRTAGYGSGVVQAWQAFSVQTRTPLSVAVATGQAVWVHSLGELVADYPVVLPSPMSQGWAALPLQVHGHMLGGLTLSFAAEQTFPPHDQALIEALAHQCAQALERTRLFAAAQSARQRLELLAEINALLGASLNYHDTLAKIAQLLVPALADCCLVYLFEDTGIAELAAVAHHNAAKAAILRALDRHTAFDLQMPPVSPAYGAILRAGEATLIDPLPAPQLLAFAIGAAHHHALGALEPASGIVVPLRVRERLLGAITLYMAESARHYTPGDLALVQELARPVESALDRALLFHEAQQARAAAERAAERTLRLQAVTAALSAALTPEQVGNVIVQAGRISFGADRAAIYLLTEGSPISELLSASGYDPALLAQYQRWPRSEPGPLQHAIDTRTVVAIENPEALRARWPALAVAQAQSRDAAFVAVPFVLDQQVLGGLYLSFRANRSFTRDDRTYLEILGQQCAQALERARLYAEERRARAAAEAAVQVRDVFLMTASHELKTPLTTLLGYSSMLEPHVGGASPLLDREQDMLRMIFEQARRLDKLVKMLLDMAQIHSGQIQLELGMIDLVALVRSVVAETRPALGQHTLVCRLPEEPLLLVGDGPRLEQALANLLQNAIKYSPQGGPIEVQVEAQGSHACVSVRDVGIGIPPQDIPHLFEWFYRGPQIDPQQIPGFGVGLYVVQEIVKRHGGTISVTSAEGQGSCFTICLALLHSWLATHGEVQSGS